MIVWRVADAAAALFDVDHFETFVNIQIETALREIASHFAYDHAEHEEPTLRADADQVSALLREKLQDRVSIAGVAIDEARLSHLAYAPEIASAMLRRQQTEAILAARQKIVAGAVSMVERELTSLSARGIVKLDDERRAAMVSNLLVSSAPTAKRSRSSMPARLRLSASSPSGECRSEAAARGAR